MKPQITDFAQGHHERMFAGYKSDFARTDPEFIERFDNFAFDEVINDGAVDGEPLDERPASWRSWQRCSVARASTSTVRSCPPRCAWA
jgi:hypothetical protein